VGAPATTAKRRREREMERERIRKQDVLRFMWICWHVSSEPIGTSALKEGAVGAVGVQSPEGRASQKEDGTSWRPSGRSGRDTVRLFGTNSLKEGASGSSFVLEGALVYMPKAAHLRLP
jgi:hypothetical protein